MTKHDWQTVYGPLLTPRNKSIQRSLKIIQTRFKLDRKAQYEFAFAVENKVTGKVTEATRKQGQTTTDLYPWAKTGVPAGEQVVENGSFMKLGLKAFFIFDEILNEKMVERITAVKPPVVEVPPILDHRTAPFEAVSRSG